MAWRLRLAPEKTHIDFFRWQWVTFGGSMALMVAAFVLWGVMGLNFGIDFQGGTSIRTDSPTAIDVGEYRKTLETLDIGDLSITEVFDPTFRADQHVAIIRLGAVDGQETVSPAALAKLQAAMTAMDPAITFVSTETVGPKVSSELIRNSILAVLATSVGIMFYIWLRFEWQFALGGVLALLHDVFITIGIFALFQI